MAISKIPKKKGIWKLKDKMKWVNPNNQCGFFFYGVVKKSKNAGK